MNVAHDDHLSLSSGYIQTRTFPIHVEQRHLQRLLTEEPQPHLLVLQDLLHRDERRVVLFRQLGDTAQDHEVALAEAGDHLLPGFALLAVVGLGEGARLLAGFLALEVVLVSAAASVDERLAFLDGGAVGPTRRVRLARPLHARQGARRGELRSARRHARLVRVEMVFVGVALPVREGEAVVALGFVVPTDALLSADIHIGFFRTLLGR